MNWQVQMEQVLFKVPFQIPVPGLGAKGDCS